MKRARWYLPEEAAADLRAEVEDVLKLGEAGEFLVLTLPSGARRIDAASFRQFLRAQQLGYRPHGGSASA